MSPLQMDVTKNDTHTKERPASALTRPSNINKIYGEKLSIYKKNEKSAQNKHFFQRKSIGVMENLFASDLLFKPIDKCNALQLGQNMMSTIEERIGIKAMEKLKEAFIEADTDRNGGLDIFEFKELLITQLHLKRSQINEIENLFHKIDLSSEGTVSWDEFCTYLQNEYSAKEMHSNSIKSMTFNLPAKCVGSPQRDNFLKICGLVDGNFVACGTEGSISFWSPNADLKRSKSLLNVDKIRKSNTKKVTDFLIFSEYNKLMLSTGEREIQFYELSSLETYCQIRGFQSLPLVMDYSVMKNTRLDTCYIIYGDSNGCITILTIQKVGECLRNWKNMKKVNGMASINIENAVNRFGVNMVVWKVHTDWVQSVQYCPEIDRIISCSNSTDNAMVIGTVSNNLNLGITKAYENVIITKDGKPIDKHQERKSLISFKVNPRKRNPSDQIVYKIYKGVKVFDYSKKKNIIATGGIIAGHNAPICFIRIAEEEERIFSFSTDNFLMVWDTQDYTCLLTLRPKTHKIRGDIVSCCYNIQSKSLLVTTDHIHSLTIKQKTVLKDFTNVSHSVALDCCLYSKKFDHVVTASHNSTVRVWSLQYGIIINEFKNAHGNSVISSMCFDSTGLK
ncbi:hypothetical protein A3Q56_06654 [Intoshia linei]|uniref:EF-hand domain-containing protein n=1 Tax=Intoshia linei TaxID=1819745 RepID=A0A177AW47_9BILA|nr:hypothetical protein A3Q56_06654 [Intoshia linei]